MTHRPLRAFLSVGALVLAFSTSTFEMKTAGQQVDGAQSGGWNENDEKYSDFSGFAPQLLTALIPDPGGLPTWAIYAPTVRLYWSEQFFPTRASFFIDHSELRFSRHEADDISVAALGNVVASRLGEASAGDAYFQDGFYAFEKTRPYELNRSPGLRERDGFFLDLGGAFDTTNERQLWRGCTNGPRCRPDLNNVPVYYEYAGPDKYIVYWFFYAYSDGWRDFNHEGDWESIVVKLANDSPTHVAFNRHGCTAIVQWRNVRKTDGTGRLNPDGTHPLVYSARGSHASYAFGRPAVRRVCGAPFGHDIIGARWYWRTWRTMRNVLNEPWYGFGGAWGEVGSEDLPRELSSVTTGPLGPSRYKNVVPEAWR